ncbi:glycoside hydrolase family 43 protein [Novosphingobium huizhouense]|uniref:glycoside hydrolase family 43 protein n=1 Tax=Novosphingobium huizhouense TaxID=2866625 RepID=UPI001CD839FE|nr:glycoside hydrolase family 43 protein [Novosphingobium huizhouense]
MTFSLSRRAFFAGSAALPIACTPMAAPLPLPPADAGPVNPLVRQRADAQVFRHDDGFYYLTGSVPEYDRLVLRRSKTIAGLATADERVLWRHQASGPMSGFIWAPELHLIDGRWIMYFAAGPSGGGEDVFRIRTFAVVCDGPDPMAGNWTVLGQFQAPWDSFCLDSTSFLHRGTRYFAWAQREPGIETNSNLYIAPLASPLTLARAATRLSIPTLDWEVRGFKVNEAPAVLARNGRLFMTYSASATDARYCLGLLAAPDDADIMDPRVWQKSQQPVFVTSPETGVFGPGHNSFTVDEQGRDILVYHGRDYEHIDGDPLFDPNRHTRVQRLYYKPDGTPDFGVPVGNGPLPVRLLRTDGAPLACEGSRVLAGAAPLAATQFRLLEDAPGIVTVAPILRRDDRLTVLADGGIALSPLAQGPAQRFVLHRERDGAVILESVMRRSFALASPTTARLVPMAEATRWRID